MRGALEWRDARLRRIRDLTVDIRLFEIEPSAGFVRPTPGSHLAIAVQIGERADMRTYTVVGPCEDGIYRIAVKRLADSRGGSSSLWRLEPGARLTISGPHTHFELAHDRPDYLLVAGGIGITPIYSMALALAEAGLPFRLLYGARRRDDFALADDLRGRIGPRLETFAGEAGERIDLEAAIATLAPGGELYICGPAAMLDDARRAWARSGRPAARLRFETFGNSGRHAQEPFTVRIPRLGREIVVRRNQTMLEALEESGIEMIHDCRRGECGLCALPILAVDGVVDHRDVFFSDDEKAADEKLCTCVSRVAGASITVDTADRFA
jgi:vanillate O-demethylase ferredoxin subunit